MKICTDCQTEKELSEFSLRSTVTGVRHNICKPCQRVIANLHYQSNKEVYKDRAAGWAKNNSTQRKAIARISTKKISKQHKRQAVDYKGGMCEDCKGVFPLCAYDFHHLDPKLKDMHLAHALNARGFEFCKEELDKCVLLCANCHRIRHHGKD